MWMGNGTTTCSRCWNYLSPGCYSLETHSNRLLRTQLRTSHRSVLITGFTASVKSETAATYGYATLENTSQHLMKKWLTNTKRFRNSKGVFKTKYLRCFVIISLKNSYGWNIDLSQDKNQQNVFPNGLRVSIYWISSGKFLCFLTTCTFYFIGNHQEQGIPLSLPVKNNCCKQAVTFYLCC